MTWTSENPSEETAARARSFSRESAMGQWFGTDVSYADGMHRYRLTFDEPHIGNPILRALHGGVISAFLEYCATLEIRSRVPTLKDVRSISVHTSYLRGSRDQDMHAEVTLQRVGRRIAFVEARGWQAQRADEVASAQIALRLFSD